MTVPRIPTEAEVAELITLTGEIARGLCFERDMLRDANRKQALHLAGAVMLLKRFTQHELPEAELDAINPGEFVVLNASHMDHEHYRHSVRLAKEFLKTEVNAE